jgi:hypothetical protein
MRWEVVDDGPGPWNAPRLGPYIEKALQEQLAGHLGGQLLVPSIYAEVWNCVHAILAETPGANSNDIKFRTVVAYHSGEVTVKPDNLYTGLLLVGHVVDGAAAVAVGDGEVTFSEGTYSFRNGEFLFRPNRPPEMIDVDISFSDVGAEVTFNGGEPAEITIPREVAEALGYQYTWRDTVRSFFCYLRSKLPFHHS